MSFFEALEVLIIYLGFFGIVTILGLTLIVLIQYIGIKVFKINVTKTLIKKLLK